VLDQLKGLTQLTRGDAYDLFVCFLTLSMRLTDSEGPRKR
jgi:hypothetical protein